MLQIPSTLGDARDTRLILPRRIGVGWDDNGGVMPQPQKKRIKLRPHVKAESDAYDRVREVLLLVFHEHVPKPDMEKDSRAIMLGRDPHAALRDAIVRGGRRALIDEVAARKVIPFREASHPC